MTLQILDPLRLYLNGDIDIDTLEDSVILFAWDDDFEDQDLLNEILVELIYIKDGLSDESIFRTRVSEIARRVESGVHP